MTLSEFVIAYRTKHNLSQRQFAELCGVSNGTISNLEKGQNPATKKDIITSIDTLKKIASAMSYSLHDLLQLVDDVSVVLDENPNPLSSERIKVSGSVPVVDGIAAGMPILAQENIVEFIPVTVKNPNEYFALIVRGDSMIGAGIPSGSKVLIHMQQSADNGQIVACRLNGDEATLKRFKQVGDTILLMPENQKYEPIVVPAKDFESGDAEIIGVVKQIIIDIQ